MSDGAPKAATGLHDLTACQMLAGFHGKQFSPSDVIEDVLAHIAAWEPHIKALYAFDPDGARKAAKDSTARWQNGAPIGPLDGVPITIKENIATKGVPVPLGAATTTLTPSPSDAPPAARVREAGAVILSKAAPAPVRARRARPATVRYISARISAARSACPRAGAASSR